MLGPDDIPGKNDVSANHHGEPLFAWERVEFAGQPLALVVATSLDAARHAAERVKADIEADEPILDIETALARKSYVQTPTTLLRGDPDAALKNAPHRLSAEFSVGGQEHFYLEGQIAFALPGEDGDIVVHSSTQHPTEVQHIARACWAATTTASPWSCAGWAAASAARRATLRGWRVRQPWRRTGPAGR